MFSESDKIKEKVVVVIENIIEEKEYCELYQELATLLSNPDDVRVIYNHFKGLSVCFPKKLYSRGYTRKYIKDNYGKLPVQEIAKTLDLSDRRIRQIAKEIKDNREGDEPS